MSSPISDYIIEQPEQPTKDQKNEEIGVAVPKVSDYRERFKNKELTINDLRPPLKERPKDKEPKYAEDDLLLGPGVEDDWI
jgi:hypothetical protein